MSSDDGVSESVKSLRTKRQEFVLERRRLALQIKSVRRAASQRIKDLSLVKGSMRKRLIEIERMSRDADVRNLQDQKDAIDREILEIDRILLTLQRLP